MNCTRLAQQAAQAKGWPARFESNGELRVEIAPYGGRTQVVTVSPAADGDGDAAAFVWSKAGETQAVTDVWGLLRLNAQLTYGRVALRGNDLVVLHALLDAPATLQEVGKTLYWVARAADDLERSLYGTMTDVL
jgi:hypothetical protein